MEIIVTLILAYILFKIIINIFAVKNCRICGVEFKKALDVHGEKINGKNYVIYSRCKTDPDNKKRKII